MTRRVVLVCGPPGAGKTTYAETLGLEVYDADDPCWAGSQAAFRTAVAKLSRDPNAQAVVIRAGATRSARIKAEQACGATETVVLKVDRETCIERVKARGGAQQMTHREVAGIHDWWDRYEPDETLNLTTSESW